MVAMTMNDFFPYWTRSRSNSDWTRLWVGPIRLCRSCLDLLDVLLLLPARVIKRPESGGLGEESGEIILL